MPGTLNFGLDGGFVTYLGWLIPWGTPVTLIGDTPAEVAEAHREMVRIGIDRPAAAATMPHLVSGAGPLERLRVARFDDVAAETLRRGRPPLILDVRRHDERRGSHLAGSLHIPVHEIASRLDEIPADTEVWVHCESGYRASVVAALLQRAGRRAVLIDDEYERAADSGLPLRGPLAQPLAGSG